MAAFRDNGNLLGSSPVTVRPECHIPEIERAFVRRLHPYWPTLQESTRAWLVAKRLMSAENASRYVDDLRYTDLMAGYYVDASDHVLQAISDFSAWFFVWDDRHDRDVVSARTRGWLRLRSALHSALDVPIDHLRHPDPIVAGFADSLVRLYSYLSEAWNARFARHFHAVIEAYDQEFRNRMAGVVPPVAEYLDLRQHTFAHWVWTDLLELSAARELPASVRRHPTFRHAALLSQEFAAWYNDLCSLPKELAGGELHNLGISLIHHEGLSREEATADLRRRTRMCVREFLAAEHAVRRLADRIAGGSGLGKALSEAVNSCTTNMRNWFSSVYWFHHESARYMVERWDEPSTPPYLSTP